MLKTILALQIIAPTGTTDDITRHFEQSTLDQTAAVCAKMESRAKKFIKKYEPKKIRVESPDELIPSRDIISAVSTKPNPFFETWIDTTKTKVLNKKINTVITEDHDGHFDMRAFFARKPPVISGSTGSNSHNALLYQGYVEQALKQLSGYKAPQKDHLARMGYVERKTWECSTEGNTSVMNWIKKTGIEPKQAQPNNFEQALQLMESDPQIQECTQHMVKKLKEIGYYKELKECYSKQDRSEAQKELTRKLYAVAGQFTSVDPRNLFRKTFGMDVLGAATVLAGHPKYGDEQATL